MKLIRFLSSAAICAALGACSVGSSYAGGGDAYYDDPPISGAGHINPSQPTGLGVGVKQEIYIQPGRKTKSGAVPPPGYQGQWWTDPQTGCEYSRATYGHQVNWTLIMNPPGKPMALASCKKHFVSEGPIAPGYRSIGGGRYVYDASTDPLRSSGRN